jgi:hypothetical protein
MIYISNKGNLSGPNPEKENLPEYIDEALKRNFEVKIDLWCSDGRLYLGEDYPRHKVSLDWLTSRYLKLWIHCKNIEALIFMQKENHFHYFWHEKDFLTLTSLNFIWVNSDYKTVENSIVYLPEALKIKFDSCLGICSDFILNY